MTCLQAMCFWRSAPLPAARWSWARQTGPAIVSTIRYMIFNCVGSGLFLLGLSILYRCTGHLLMSNLHAKILEYAGRGEYIFPMIASFGLMTIGLAAKSRPVPLPQLAARRPQQRHHRLKRCLVGPGAQGLCDLSDQTHHPGVQPRCGGPLALSRAVVCLWLARHDHRIGPGAQEKRPSA